MRVAIPKIAAIEFIFKLVAFVCLIRNVSGKVGSTLSYSKPINTAIGEPSVLKFAYKDYRIREVEGNIILSPQCFPLLSQDT